MDRHHQAKIFSPLLLLLTFCAGLDEGSSLSQRLLSRSPSPYSRFVTLFENTQYDWILVEYDIADLRECTNLPHNALHKVSSIATRGNCVRLYEYQNCQGQMLEFAGPDDGLDHGSFINDNFNDIASSIIACDSMIQISGNALNFKFLTNLTYLLKDGNLDKLEMASSSHFINDGTTPIKKSYKEKKTYKETYVFEKMESLSKLTSFGVSAGISVVSDVGIPYLDHEEVKAELKAAFQFQSQEEYRRREEHKREESKEFTVEETFKVPPCSVYNVSSFMMVKEDIPVEYEMEAQIHGRIIGGRTLTAEELRKRLHPGMVYLKDVNSEEILVRVKGTISSSLGVRSEVEVKQSSILGCGGGGIVEGYGLVVILGCVGISVGISVLLVGIFLKYRRSRLYTRVN